MQPSTWLVHGVDDVGLAEALGDTEVLGRLAGSEVVALVVGVGERVGSVVHGAGLLGSISDNLQSLPLYVNVTFVTRAF